MNLTQLINQLKTSIPDELYAVEPGQVAMFVPKNGISVETASSIYENLRKLSSLGFEEQISLHFLPTDKPELLGGIVARKESETGSPYNVIISDNFSLVGFCAEYFNLEQESLAGRTKNDLLLRRKLNLSAPPIIVSLDPQDSPREEGNQESASKGFSCPYMNGGGDGSIHALVAEKNIPSQEEMIKKLSILLSQCERYGYDVDVQELKRQVKEDLQKANDYKLELDLQYKEHGRSRVLGVCDIYIVGDGEKHKIDIRPAEKALYLATIIQDGFLLQDPSLGFLTDMATIFNLMPDHQERGKISDKEQSVSGITVMKRRVRKAIESAIGYGIAVEEFAIEGYRGQKVSIRKATQQHRDMIKEMFGL